MNPSENIGLLRRAKADFSIAELILGGELSDPVQLDIAAYHLQQTVEKLLKHRMVENGIAFKFVHEIDVLCDQMEDNGISPPEWVRKSESVLTDYGTKTRHHNTIIASKTKLNSLMPLAKEFLEQQIQESLKLQAVQDKDDAPEH